MLCRRMARLFTISKLGESEANFPQHPSKSYKVLDAYVYSYNQILPSSAPKGA